MDKKISKDKIIVFFAFSLAFLPFGQLSWDGALSVNSAEGITLPESSCHFHPKGIIPDSHIIGDMNVCDCGLVEMGAGLNTPAECVAYPASIKAERPDQYKKTLEQCDFFKEICGVKKTDESQSQSIDEDEVGIFGWLNNFWDGLRSYASEYWNSKASSTSGLASLFYGLMAGLARYGSLLNISLLAISIIPLGSITKLFAFGDMGPTLTMGEVDLGLANIPVVFKNIPYSGVAGVGNGVKYAEAGSIAIKETLANNPISSVLIRHEAAHILGASEVEAWKITSQAFSSLSWGEKIKSLGTLSGVNTAITAGLEKTLPTLNHTIMQLGYFGNAFKGLTWNIWKGYL